MKTLVTILVALALFTSSKIVAQTTVTATVVNVTSNEGKVGFALYNKANFMLEPVQAKAVEVKENKSTVVFKNIPAGDYAIICYHDKNSNGKMDFTPQGMPMEDYGTSNNVMSFGPPQFDNAKFTVADKDVSLEIKF